MKKLQLHKFLTKTGMFAGKKEIIDAIKNSEIKIGDRIILNPIYQFNPKKEMVYWKGKKIEALAESVYIILNKPEGYLSSRLAKKDIELGKKSMFDLIKVDEKTKKTLFSVGRLDEDTSGLIIITNDGKLCAKLANPKHGIGKTYEVLLEKSLSEKEKIESGIVIELEENGRITKYKTKPCKIFGSGKKVQIALTEGKKREVRRIFEAVGNKVIALQRISIGSINLKELNLEKGKFIQTDLKFIEEKIK